MSGQCLDLVELDSDCGDFEISSVLFRTEFTTILPEFHLSLIADLTKPCYFI